MPVIKKKGEKKRPDNYVFTRKKNLWWVRKALLVWDIRIIRILLTIPGMQRKQINLTPSSSHVHVHISIISFYVWVRQFWLKLTLYKHTTDGQYKYY